MDIKKLIGETTEYDKKQSVEIRRPKSWLKSVSAFANGDGGYLIFGIADDGTVVGLLDAEKDAEAISERIKARMDPIPEFFLSFEEEENKTLIILKIGKGEEDSSISTEQMAAFIGVSAKTIKRHIKKMNNIKYVGSGYSGHWEIEE